MASLTGCYFATLRPCKLDSEEETINERNNDDIVQHDSQIKEVLPDFEGESPNDQTEHNFVITVKPPLIEQKSEDAAVDSPVCEEESSTDQITDVALQKIEDILVDTQVTEVESPTDPLIDAAVRNIRINKDVGNSPDNVQIKADICSQQSSLQQIPPEDSGCNMDTNPNITSELKKRCEVQADVVVEQGWAILAVAILKYIAITLLLLPLHVIKVVLQTSPGKSVGALLILAILSAQIGVCDEENMQCSYSGPCPKGHFYQEGHEEMCVPCPNGTWISQENHQCVSCKKCKLPNLQRNQAVIVNCTPTSDTKIGCLDGYEVWDKRGGEVHGSNDPYCRRMRFPEKNNTTVSENKTTVSPGNVNTKQNITPTVNDTTPGTGSDSHNLVIVLSIAIPAVLVAVAICCCKGRQAKQRSTRTDRNQNVRSQFTECVKSLLPRALK